MTPTIRLTACYEDGNVHEDAIIIMPEDTMKDGFKAESIIITNNNVHVMVSAPTGGGSTVDVLTIAKEQHPI